MAVDLEHSLGIQMKQKELTKILMMMSNCKNPLAPRFIKDMSAL